MNSKSNIGKTIIDKLMLCYIADSDLLNDLRTLQYGDLYAIEDFRLQRIECEHYGCGFNILMYTQNNNYEKFATLKFDKYLGNRNQSEHVYIEMENHILYDSEKLNGFLLFLDETGLLLNNISSIDLAKDLQTDICSKIKRIYKDKTITTILNGKAIKDRKRVIPEMTFTYSVSLDRLKYPTFNARQKKACHNKTKGVCIYAYNKVAEIMNASNKQYILDFYGNPKRLHRLEVHLNSNEIRNYCNGKNIEQSTDLLFNQEFLTQMYMYHLSSVLRFTRGRDRIRWNDIFNGGTI